MFNSAQQQSVFGQNNNLCAPKPFGSPTTPFGSQTGVSMFSGTSTGNFGGGTQAFSSPAFGNPVSSFGTPTFSPAFSTSIFGQKPASTFGVNPNTPTFGTPTTPALGTATTPGFGSQQTAPAFGIGLGGVFGVTSAASTTAPFGSQPNSGFGNNPFSSNPSPFGTQSSSFSFQTTTPSTFGTPVTFGQAVFGQQKRGGSRAVAYAPTELEDSALGTGKVKVHSIPFMPVYAQKSHEELRWDDYQLGDKGGLIPAATPQSNPFCTTQPNTLTTTPNQFSYGQKTTSFPSYTPGSTTSNLFGTGSSLTSTAVFNQPSTPFTHNFGTTSSTTPAFTAPAFNFGTTPSTTPAFTAPTFNFGTTSSTTPASTPTFNFGTTPSSTPPFNFGTTTSSTTSTATSPFSSATGTTNTFGLTIGVPPKFQQTNNALGQFSSSVFAPVSTTSSCAPLTNTAGSQNSGFWNNSFNSTPGTTFGLTIGTPPAFQQTNNASWKFSSSAFAPVSTTSSCALVTNTVGTQNSGFWNNSFNPTPGTTNTFGLTIGVPPTFQQANNALGQFSNSAPSQPSWSNTVTGQTNPSQQTQPAFSFPSSGQQQQLAFSFPNSGQQQQPAFSFPNSGQQQQPAVSSGGYNVSTGVGVVTSGVFNSIPPNSFGPFGQNAFPQMSTGNQSDPAATQPSVVAMNPFGTLPAMPQISIGHTRAAPSIQYGISKMPVVDKVAPVRVPSSLITSRHLSQRRIRLPARSSCPNDCARVPFFSDDVEAPSTPKADALCIPRENPRVFVLRPLEHWTSRTSSEQSKDTNNTPLHENENGHAKERTDIETLMPKLRYPEYYTEPRIQELAAKEREEPGFCGRVKDFTVGRHGFGSIKLAGETDVRNLDLESLVQFNNREVIVYLDDSKKPPVGQGLNKSAVVTLLNIKCFDKKTGQQYLEGVKVEKYKELLMKKTVDQGAEFVSYDPIKGEWKFRVNHF